MVDLSGDAPTLLRPGGVTVAELRSVIPDLRIGEHLLPSNVAAETPETNEPKASPGMMTRHYCPQAQLECYTSGALPRIDELLRQGRSVAWMSTSTGQARQVAKRIAMSIDPAGFAAKLYSALHECDSAGVDHIVVELPFLDDRWLTVRDRLHRAATIWAVDSDEPSFVAPLSSGT
ncbi:MAG: Sua5 family C-terminal domain-containing protein [Pirellulales bacterium]